MQTDVIVTVRQVALSHTWCRLLQQDEDENEDERSDDHLLRIVWQMPAVGEEGDRCLTILPLVWNRVNHCLPTLCLCLPFHRVLDNF